MSSRASTRAKWRAIRQCKPPVALPLNPTQTVHLRLPPLIQEKPQLERPHFGITFNKEDRCNLPIIRNLVRIEEVEFKKGEETPVYVSLDPQTNEIVTCHVSKVKVPDTYKGARLNEEQQQRLPID